MRYLQLHGFTGTPDSLAGIGAPPGSLAPALGGHLHTPLHGDFDDEVERLAALAGDAPGLLGYSLGGRFALGMLARHPERFRHAVVISAQPGLSRDSERAHRREADQRFIQLLREQGLEAFVDTWQKLPLWASQGGLPEATRQAQRAQRLRHDAEGLAQSLERHGLGEMPDYRDRLKQVKVPVDLVVGERDEKFVKLAQELMTLLPAARLTIVPDVGHNVLLESPPTVARLLLQGSSP